MVEQETNMWRQCEDQIYKPEWGYYDGSGIPIAIVDLDETRPVITISASAENGQWMIFIVLRKTKAVMDYREFTSGHFITRSRQQVQMSADIHTPSFPLDQLHWSTFPGPTELIQYGLRKVSESEARSIKCPELIPSRMK